MAVSRKLSLNRYRQVIVIFAKYGFGYIINHIGILKYLNIRKLASSKYEDNSKHSTGVRLRLAFEELGTTFIKLGQILSTRQELFAPDILDELKKLQDSVKPFSFDEVKTIIENEFDDKIDNIFSEFIKTPIASASISQVHYAKTISGKNVAVKVQRPNIEKSIDADITILKDLASFIDNRTKYGKFYDFGAMVIEFETILKNELDFRNEGDHADKFQENFKNDNGCRVPKIEWIYTTSKVLTMEYISGSKIDDKAALEKDNIDKEKLALNLAESICNQVLRDGFFHADPHPGNIMVTQDGTIVFIDMGIVGQITENRKYSLSSFFIGIVTKDSRSVVRSIIDLSSTHKKRGLREFESDIEEIIEKYLLLSWNQIKIGPLINDIFKVAFLNNIKIPKEFALMTKTLITLQYILEDLAPDLNTFVVAKPIAQKFFINSFSVKRIANGFRKSILDYNELFKEIPYYLFDFLDKIEKGDFKVQIDMSEIDGIQKKLDKIFNRISFSIMLLAVSLIIASIIIGSSLTAGLKDEMYILSRTVLKIGLFVAGGIIFGLIISIIRSNRI